MIHSLTKVYSYRDISDETRIFIMSLQMAIMYATPMFVLLSEFISSNVAKGKIKKGFLLNKVKYILIPYIIMATVYTVNLYIKNKDMGGLELLEVWKNILMGQWHGYFVIIIFQFYILHILYVKYTNNINPAIVLTISFVISISYWVYYNFFFVYSYDFFYKSFVLPKILFFGWLFYFSIAYYCGKDYERFVFKLNQLKWWILFGFIMTFAIVQLNFYYGLLPDIASTRFDIVFYTVMVFFLIFLIASKLNKMPYWLLSISSYSYGIYLLHPIIQEQIVRYFEEKVINGLSFLLIQFIAGVFIPIVIVFFVTKIPFGEFIVGKLKFPRKQMNN